MPPENVNINRISGSTGVPRVGARRGALIAPIDPGATVSANVVKTYYRPSDAEADHGSSSKIAAGVKAAINSGLGEVVTVAMAKASGSPYTESFSSASDTLANVPVFEVTSADNSGTALSVIYTTEDPATASPAPSTTELLVNPKTGKFKTGASVTASSLSITYDVYNLSAAWDELALEQFEYVTFAGLPYNAQHFGIFDALLTNAAAEHKLVAAGLDSAAVPADVQKLVEAQRTGRLFLVAAHYTGDLNAATMAHRVTAPIAATAKETPAPAGVSYSDSYLFKDYGKDLSETAGEFHNMGVNAVYRDSGGAYRLTNDRACTGVTDTDKFHSTFRSKIYAEDVVNAYLVALRRSSGSAIPYDSRGLLRVKNALRGAMGVLHKEGIVDKSQIAVPPLSAIPEGDRANRVLKYVEVKVRLTGQVHVVDLDLVSEV